MKSLCSNIGKKTLLESQAMMRQHTQVLDKKSEDLIKNADFGHKKTKKEKKILKLKKRLFV